MFDGVEMPVVILLSFPGVKKDFTTARVGRIYKEERHIVLESCVLTSHDIRQDGHRVAKIGTEVELNILRKVTQHSTVLGYLCTDMSDYSIYYQEACRYWLKACAGLPYFKSKTFTQYTMFTLDGKLNPRIRFKSRLDPDSLKQ